MNATANLSFCMCHTLRGGCIILLHDLHEYYIIELYVAVCTSWFFVSDAICMLTCAGPNPQSIPQSFTAHLFTTTPSYFSTSAQFLVSGLGEPSHFSTWSSHGLPYGTTWQHERGQAWKVWPARWHATMSPQINWGPCTACSVRIGPPASTMPLDKYPTVPPKNGLHCTHAMCIHVLWSLGASVNFCQET